MTPEIGAPFRVGFVPGVTPDTWARRWPQQMPRQPLDLVPLGERDGVALVRSGDLQMCFVRLPVDRTGLHVITLYDEQPVAVVAAEHPAAAYDEIPVADLADEHLLQDVEDVPAWRDVATEVADGSRYPVPSMTLPQAVESVAADAGILILPMSLARLYHRKDVRHVAVRDVPPTTIALVWRAETEAAQHDALHDAQHDDRAHKVETFIGVVRGRTVNSSRGREPTKPETQPETNSEKQLKKQPAGQRAGKPANQRGRPSSRTRARRRRNR